MPLELDEATRAVRRFSRFYTARMETLAEGLLDSKLPLAEARLLYEIATSGEATVSRAAAAMRLDPGYVSRLVGRLEERKLVRRMASPTDGRQSLLLPTRAGRKQFEDLDQASNRQAAGMLERLGPEKQRELVRAMGLIERLMGGDGAAMREGRPFLLRGHRPGDMGWVVYRHGAIYAREYGWDERFEALVARIAADFIDHFEARSERCWIAERDGEFLGCVFVLKDREAEKTAKLRLLLVEPAARGQGVGSALVRQCTEFARQAGYERIVLWTNSVLGAARRIYEREGYRFVREEPHESFGTKLVGQYWELSL